MRHRPVSKKTEKLLLQVTELLVVCKAAACTSQEPTDTEIIYLHKETETPEQTYFLGRLYVTVTLNQLKSSRLP